MSAVAPGGSTSCNRCSRAGLGGPTKRHPIKANAKIPGATCFHFFEDSITTSIQPFSQSQMRPYCHNAQSPCMLKWWSQLLANFFFWTIHRMAEPSTFWFQPCHFGQDISKNLRLICQTTDPRPRFRPGLRFLKPGTRT